MRSALAYVLKGRRSMVAAGLRQGFLQPDRATAEQTSRQVAEQMRRRWLKLSVLIDDSEHGVLGLYDDPGPASH